MLWVQEVTTTFFVYGIFIGTAAASRRNDHLYLSAISEAMTGRARLAGRDVQPPGDARRRVVHGLFRLLNFLQGFSAFRMPSLTPLASLYAAIPLSGALVALFTVEQLVNGWRNGFAGPGGRSRDPQRHEERATASTMTAANGLIVVADGGAVPGVRLSRRAGRLLR